MLSAKVTVRKIIGSIFTLDLVQRVLKVQIKIILVTIINKQAVYKLRLTLRKEVRSKAMGELIQKKFFIIFQPKNFFFLSPSFMNDPRIKVLCFILLQIFNEIHEEKIPFVKIPTKLVIDVSVYYLWLLRLNNLMSWLMVIYCQLYCVYN